MIIRRTVAAILVFLFVISSVAALTVFAISNTFFRASFYEEDLSQETYEFLISSTVKNLMNENEFVQDNFTEADLRREIITVFPESIFNKMVKQLVAEMEILKQDPSKPITLKLGTYRESLLTLAHNMSFRVFESIPKCRGGEIPEEGINDLPTCVPSDVEYNVIAAPFSEEFEKAIYAAVPEQVQLDLNATIGDEGFVLSNSLKMLDTVKIIFYLILLSLLVLIALVIWKPFVSVLTHEGLAFFFSGLLGLILSYALYLIPPVIAENINGELLKEDIRKLIEEIIGLFSLEVQKGAYIFLALGAILILVRFFMKKR
jgi:hypothetical protein